MIIFNYRNDAIRPIFDDKVSLALKCSILGGGNDMIIGIENMEGEIYRVVTTTGMRQVSFYQLDLKIYSLVLYKGKVGLIVDLNPQKNYSTKNRHPEISRSTQSQKSSQIDSLENLPETERISIVLSRVGQGIFREKVIAHWKACAVTNSTTVPLLRAPHIKPWRNSTNIGRLDPFNGLLLTPNIDSAFDAGYITLDPNGKIIPSHLLNKTEASNPNISAE